MAVGPKPTVQHRCVLTSNTTASVAREREIVYMGPMFRRERPQKGRYRQFYQIGAEVLGAVRRAGD